MRLDYVSYTIALIFFIITISAVAFTVEQQQVWIVSTVVIGLVFIGLGYTQRPRSTYGTTKSVTAETQSTASPPPQQQPLVVVTQPSEAPAIEVKPVEEAKSSTVEQPEPQPSVLTKIKGIGEKRAAQLKALNISTIEDLEKASPTDLAAKLNISPKITSKWVEKAKELKATS